MQPLLLLLSFTTTIICLSQLVDATVQPACRATLYGLGNNAALQLSRKLPQRLNGTNALTQLLDSDRTLDSSNIAQICVGSDHTCILMKDGKSMHCRGSNLHFQFCAATGAADAADWTQSDLRNVLTPSTTIAQIACGDRYTLILTSDGTVFGCGFDADGRVSGAATSSDAGPLPVRVLGELQNQNIIKISAGSHSAAVSSSGAVFAWGNNDNAQLSQARPEGTMPGLVALPYQMPISQILTVYNRTIVLYENGTAIAVGNSANGCFGTGLGWPSFYPSWVVFNDRGALLNRTITSVASGESHILLLDSSGKTYSAGRNDRGQLGLVQRSDAFVAEFQRVAPPLYMQESATQVYAARYTSFLRTNLGRVYVFGSNEAGLLDLGEDEPLFSNQPRAMWLGNGKRAFIDLNVLDQHLVTNTGFDAQTCQNLICEDIPAGDPFVCHGRGRCVGSDICDCSATQQRYGGSDCDVPLCRGILATDPTVCNNGRGKCVSPDLCVDCQEHYYGQNCDRFSCDFKQHDSPLACNGHGSCFAHDNCTCTDGYSGQFCQFASCYGIPASDTRAVCSGFGVCLEHDTCTCRQGYIGATCRFNWITLVIGGVLLGLLFFILATSLAFFLIRRCLVKLLWRQAVNQAARKGIMLEDEEVAENQMELN